MPTPAETGPIVSTPLLSNRTSKLNDQVETLARLAHRGMSLEELVRDSARECRSTPEEMEFALSVADTEGRFSVDYGADLIR